MIAFRHVFIKLYRKFIHLLIWDKGKKLGLILGRRIGHNWKLGRKGSIIGWSLGRLVIGTLEILPLGQLLK